MLPSSFNWQSAKCTDDSEAASKVNTLGSLVRRSHHDCDLLGQVLLALDGKGSSGWTRQSARLGAAKGQSVLPGLDDAFSIDADLTEGPGVNIEANLRGLIRVQMDAREAGEYDAG